MAVEPFRSGGRRQGEKKPGWPPAAKTAGHLGGALFFEIRDAGAGVRQAGHRAARDGPADRRASARPGRSRRNGAPRRKRPSSYRFMIVKRLFATGSLFTVIISQAGSPGPVGALRVIWHGSPAGPAKAKMWTAGEPWRATSM